MNLKNMTRGELVDYIAAQLDAFFPDRRGNARHAIEQDLDEALDRQNVCINAVRWWKEDEFDYLHSSQHCILVAYLANTIWRNRQADNLCAKLFGLNKALHGFDCFYNTDLPERWFIGHSVGVVLARTAYPEYLVLYQGATVGKNHGKAPVLEEGVVLYPGASIIGDCRIGRGTIVGQNCSIIDQDTPGDCYAFSSGGRLSFKPRSRDVLADIFRLQEETVS